MKVSWYYKTNMLFAWDDCSCLLTSVMVYIKNVHTIDSSVSSTRQDVFVLT